MGWKSTLARIGGVALMPFTGGASLPVGNAIAGALDNRDAVSKTNEQLQEGVGQATAAMQPYTQLGGNAAGALNTLMGFGAGAGGGAGAAPAAPTPMPAKTMPAELGGLDVAKGGGLHMQRQSLADFAAPAMARQQTQSSFVRMRAPDGEEQDVPVDEVPLFEQHGIRRVEARA